MSDSARELGSDPDAPTAARADIADVQFLVFRIGTTLIGVAPGNVDRIVAPLRPVRIPTAPTHVLGRRAPAGPHRHYRRLAQRLERRWRKAPDHQRVAYPGATRRRRHVRSRGAASAGPASDLRDPLRAPEQANDGLRASVYTAEYDAAEGVVTVMDVERLFVALSGG